MSRSPSRSSPLPADEVRRVLLASQLRFKHPEWSQSELAHFLGTSPATVSRLLSRAQQFIRYSFDGPRDEGLALEIAAEYELRDALVVECGDDDDATVSEVLGRSAAKYLAERLITGHSVALSCGRTLLHLVSSFQYNADLGVEIGALSIEADSQSIEESPATLVGILKTKLPKSSCVFAAQLLLTMGEDWDKVYRRGLRSSKTFQESMERIRSSTWTVVGIGTGRTQGTSFYRIADTIMGGRWDREAERLGVAGEIANQPYSENGVNLIGELDPDEDHVMSLVRLEELQHARKTQRSRHIVGVAGGRSKLNAVKVALEAGFLTTLITDRRLAEQLVDST